MDRIVEIPYHFMRARVRHELGQYGEAQMDWNLLQAIRAEQAGQAPIEVKRLVDNPQFRPVLHDYEAGLTLALAANTEDRLRGKAAWAGRAEQFQKALNCWPN